MTAKPFHDMTRLDALNHFLARAEKMSTDLGQLYTDVCYCEERWPGQFTEQKLGISSDWHAAKLKVKSLRIQRNAEADK